MPVPGSSARAGSFGGIVEARKKRSTSVSFQSLQSMSGNAAGCEDSSAAVSLLFSGAPFPRNFARSIAPCSVCFMRNDMAVSSAAIGTCAAATSSPAVDASATRLSFQPCQIGTNSGHGAVGATTPKRRLYLPSMLNSSKGGKDLPRSGAQTATSGAKRSTTSFTVSWSRVAVQSKPSSAQRLAKIGHGVLSAQMPSTWKEWAASGARHAAIVSSRAKMATLIAPNVAQKTGSGVARHCVC
mmetsp:Transcript_30186/g.83016  ORF Transcript_30186/g.83016 Transcript_30186/m.83016 type:complete len:241 (-) Transcript_30186:83-805(-)